ncbi:hypothetical protein TRIUR3_00563 [Triticum urartu]|uniref:Bidirectional sugar transporter SWEET n=1 Tax=Triticum urartu TaxID=4572 RepID=M7ZTK7_TRIUA|nr:hypothetical protein TRIUR3_00563 [Triticum urartu]
MPVRKEGSVGDRMVYGSILALVNNVMWAMYAASDSLESKLFFFIVNGVSFVCQICYSILYIHYAEGKKSVQALRLVLASCVVALIMAALVPSMVMTQRWSSTWVGVLAASFLVSTHIVSAWDMLMVMKRKQIIYIDRVITTSCSLIDECIWTAYGFKSAPINFYALLAIFGNIWRRFGAYQTWIGRLVNKSPECSGEDESLYIVLGVPRTIDERSRKPPTNDPSNRRPKAQPLYLVASIRSFMIWQHFVIQS